MSPAVRWTSHPQVIPDCPVCGRALPPVVIDVDGRAEGGTLRVLDVRVRVLDEAWWDAAEQDHLDCGVRFAQQQYLAGLS